MDILKYIPIGMENAVERPFLCQMTGLSDRDMRKEIARVRREHPILNTQEGNGYYQPSLKDKEEVKRYINQESKRAKSIFYALKGAKDWLKDIDNSLL